MRFENNFMLFLLWFVPVLIIFFYFSLKHRHTMLEMFCSNEICKKIIDGYSVKRRLVKCVLIVIVTTLLLLTLARPQWGFVWEDIHRKGVDIYIAIDVSKSMLAEDVDPNRLERAKRELIDFMNILEGDRIGLVVFAGSSFIQCPLTLDYDAIQMFIDNITPDSIPTNGTSIGSAVQTCLDAFNRSAESSSKAIILITDGEDHMGNLMEVAKEAQKQNVQIYSIGVGTPEGATIPENGQPKKDMMGNTVLSKANFDQLKEISNLTGGIYTNSVTGNLDIENIYFRGIKQRLKSKDLKTTRQKNWIDRFQWPLALALLLLLFEFFINEKRPAKKVKNKKEG